MQALEKILEEIDEMIERYKENPRLEIVDICYGLNQAKHIILKHMSGKDKDVPANNGWIPVGKFGFPRDNEHDFRFWITIQYATGFGRTIKAKWDCFDKCFIHQNGKKISQDVIAYKYYSLPEPYHPEPKSC